MVIELVDASLCTSETLSFNLELILELFNLASETFDDFLEFFGISIPIIFSNMLEP
jgi:hypothetical protein